MTGAGNSTFFPLTIDKTEETVPEPNAIFSALDLDSIALVLGNETDGIAQLLCCLA